jgi:hypothetical protein
MCNVVHKLESDGKSFEEDPPDFYFRGAELFRPLQVNYR